MNEPFLRIMEERHGHPARWPKPHWRKPLPWPLDRRARSDEAELNQVLKITGRPPIADRERRRFWREVRRGQQLDEDAGGYLMRCYEAMLGLKLARTAPTYRTDQAVERARTDQPLEQQGYEPRGEPLDDHPAQAGEHYIHARSYEQGRSEALEEAARIVMQHGFRTSPGEKAAAIRALKGRQSC